jgi:hypothetical protein
MLTGHEVRVPDFAILSNDRLFPILRIREWLCVFGVIGSALAAAVGPPGTIPTNSAPVHTAPPEAVWSGPCTPTQRGRPVPLRAGFPECAIMPSIR